MTTIFVIVDMMMSAQMKETPMVLKNHLKEYRARINVNQENFGRLVGVSRQTISLIERGDYSPSVTLALKIADVLRVSVEDIFYLEGGQGNETYYD